MTDAHPWSRLVDDGRGVLPGSVAGEIGLARLYKPAPEVAIEVAFRGHRIETHYDYSFRILSNVNLKWR